MKTPMQELIDWINDYPTEATTIHKSAIIAKARELLKKEKEVIMDAYDAGLFDGSMDDVDNRLHKNYYNKTFNTK